MNIKKIVLKNKYKRFHHLTIDLGENPSRIVALVGANGCGKSSVFDGMMFLQSVYEKIGSSSGKGQEFHSMDGGLVNHNNIDILFDSGAFASVRDTLSKVGKSNTIFSFRSSYRYNQNLDIKAISAIPDITKNSYGAATSIDLDDKMTLNYQRLFIKYDKILHELDLKPSEADIKVIGELNEYIKNCLDLEIHSLGNIQDNKGKLFLKKRGHPSPFDFNVLSAGEKEVIDIILDLYLRRDEYDNTVYIFDEPELHLNTAIQRKLLIEINKIIPNNCQIWIATHSIGFLRAIQNELGDESSIIYFSPELNLATEETTLFPMENNRENWKEIFSTALDDIVGLLSPENIIFCEGKPNPDDDGKEVGFNAIIYNNIFKNEFSNYYFVSSDGCSQVENYSEIALVVLKKAFLDVNIIKLIDKDNNSEIERNTYIATSGRMLKRYSIENYLLDKEIIMKFCIKNGKVFNEQFYNEHISDIINLKVKNKVGIFMQKYSSIIDNNVFLKKLSEEIISETNIYKELKACIFD